MNLEEIKVENGTLNDNVKEGKNIIYGVGTIGIVLSKILRAANVEVSCFVISDGYAKKNQSNFNGIPIYEISKNPFDESECNIFVTTQASLEIIDKNLREKKYKNIVNVNSTKITLELYKVFYKEYFKEKNIEIDRDVIDINGCRMVNPFKQDEDFQIAFFYEANDLILPELMKDISDVNEGPYENEEVILEKDDVVFDCGANIGLFSTIAAWKGCITYAFEPIYENQLHLEKSKNLYQNLIKICPFALGEKVGIAKFYMCDKNISHTMIKNQADHLENCIDVEITTIDQFVKDNKIEKLDFIKADIEGAERYMLMGAKESIAKFSPKISICTYHLEDDPQVLERIIKEANPNYIIKHRWKKIYAYVPKDKRI